MLYSSLAGDYAAYYDWLMDRVGGEAWWGALDQTMVRIFERKYYWTNPIDGNIKEHIENLRAEALRDGVCALYIPIGEPSVLEVLVYFAKAVESEIMFDGDTEPGERVPEFFEAMIQKVGFDCDVNEVDRALDEFLSGERRFGPGSILWNQVQMLFLKQFEVESG